MTTPDAPGLPVKRRVMRCVVSLLVAGQIPVVAWLAGVDFSVRSGYLAVTYAATAYFAIVIYAFPGWNTVNE